jgi:hypothetical protein
VKARSITFAATLLAAVALGLSPGAASGQTSQSEFRHDDHRGLFPLCTGCHTGIPAGDRASFYPEPSSCASCHDGRDLQRVRWAPSQTPETNLDYSHPAHFAAAEREGEEMECASCHQEPGSGRMLGVLRADAAQCLSCHEHQADQHFQDAECTTCHVPLAESNLSLERIAALDAPPDHDDGAFLAAVHGEAAPNETARCATCHTQNRCAACHVNAGQVAAIQAIPVAPASLRLPVSAVHYSIPTTHESFAWLQSHGSAVPSSASMASDCSTCHTRNDCTSCHVDPAPRPIQGLPARQEVPAPGVGLERAAPETHTAFGFLNAHGSMAAADEGTCATCHTEESCIACHSAPQAPTYHPVNFVQQHAAAAYGQTMECQSCHSQEQFCRSCHMEQGLGSRGRLGPGYHDGQALWLFQHGAAARQQLETCASCHTQNECLQCHSQKGAFKVNPHGPNFDAEAARKRNAQICLACHLTPPLGGG